MQLPCPNAAPRHVLAAIRRIIGKIAPALSDFQWLAVMHNLRPYLSDTQCTRLVMRDDRGASVEGLAPTERREGYSIALAVSIAVALVAVPRAEIVLQCEAVTQGRIVLNMVHCLLDKRKTRECTHAFVTAGGSGWLAIVQTAVHPVEWDGHAVCMLRVDGTLQVGDSPAATDARPRTTHQMAARYGVDDDGD
jgi:hypothetical protein